MNPESKWSVGVLVAFSLVLARAVPVPADGTPVVNGMYQSKVVHDGGDILGIELSISISNDLGEALSDATLTVRDPLLPEDYAARYSFPPIETGAIAHGLLNIEVSAETYEDWLEGRPPLASLTFSDASGAQLAATVFLDNSPAAQ